MEQQQSTLILEIKTFSPQGLGGQKKSTFEITLDNTQVLIAAYLRGTQKFETLRILKEDKSCIAEVHSWMIESIKTINNGKEDLVEKYAKELRGLIDIQES